MKRTVLFAMMMFTVVWTEGEAAVSLSLSQSVEMALSANERIQSAEAAREAAKWSLSAARRSMGPVMSWSSQAYRIGGRDYASARNAHDRYGDPHTVTQKTISGYVMDQHDYPVISEQTVTVGAYAMNNTFSNRWTLSYPLYTGGRLEGQADAGGYALNAADLTLENTRQLVRYQAEGAYWGLVHRQDLVKVAKDAVDRSNIQLRLIDAQYDEGAVAKADVLIMQVRLANHRQNLVTAEGNLKVAKATLASIVGLPQDTDIQTIDTLPYERYPLSLNECEAFAVEHRPDFAAAEYEVKRGEAQMDAAKSGYRPAVTALFSKNMSSNEPFRDERSSAWNAGLDFSWNVFDNAVTSAKVASAKAQVAQYQAEAELVGKNVRLETRSAYFRMKAAEENIDAAASAVKQAEESCMIAEVRYEEGVDILLNLTDAQEQLTQAQSNYYTALYEYNFYRAALAKAMGIPVGMSVPRYLAAARAGKSSSQAMEDAAVSMEPSGSLTEQE